MYRLFCLSVLVLSFSLAAWLAASRHTHGQPALLDFDAISAAPGAALPAIRPPFYRLPDAPRFWLALNVLCGAGFGAWLIQRRMDPAFALLFAVFTPAIVSILVGQDSLILLAALCGVFLLLERRRPIPAGLLLSLWWVKFQFLPAFVLLLLMRREWRALAGFTAGSFLLLAPVAPQLPGYAAGLFYHPERFAPCRECMPNIHALIPNFTAAGAVSLGLLAISAMRFHKLSLKQAFALALIAAPLAGMHTHVYDIVLLFFAVLLAERPRLPVALLWSWAASPVPWLIPYFWMPGRITPALTALAMWLLAILPVTSESAREPGKYRTA